MGMVKDYQPDNPLASLENAQNIIAKGEPVITSIRKETFPVYSKAVADTEEEVETAVSLTGKIRSSRTKKKPKEEVPDAPPAEHSTSQRTYDYQIAFFSELIGVFTTNGKYKPKQTGMLPVAEKVKDYLSFIYEYGISEMKYINASNSLIRRNNIVK